MIVLLFISLMLFLVGYVCIGIGFHDRKPEIPFFSLSHSLNPWKLKPHYRTIAGWRFAFGGGLLLSLGGLFSTIYYFMKS